MTKEDIIRMAQEAGIKGPLPARQGFRMFASPYRLQRFATLVAAAEREACAKVCEGRTNRCKPRRLRSYAKNVSGLPPLYEQGHERLPRG